MTQPFYAGQRLTAAALDAVVPVTAFAPVSQLINSTSNVNIGGLTWAVQPGTYILTATIFGTQGAANASQALGLAGPTASSVAVSVVCFDTTAGITSPNQLQGVFTTGALGFRGSIGTITNTHTFVVWLSGPITFTAAGALTVTASCVTSAADTWTVTNGVAQLATG